MRPAKWKKTPSRAMANGMRAPVKVVTWSAPSADTAIATVSHAAPREPAKDCTTSEATCCEAAIAAARERVRDGAARAVSARRSLEVVADSDANFQTLAGSLRYRTTADADPARVYHNIAVAIDPARQLFNGQPGTLGYWMDQLALAPAFALALGAAGHDAAEPLGTGLAKGWRGRIAFQALRGLLPGGSELQPVSGVIKSDGQSLSFDSIKGKIGGGEVTASMDAKQGANGIALNASVQFSGVDGTALRYRNLAMPAGRPSRRSTIVKNSGSSDAACDSSSTANGASSG